MAVSEVQAQDGSNNDTPKPRPEDNALYSKGTQVGGNGLWEVLPVDVKLVPFPPRRHHSAVAAYTMPQEVNGVKYSGKNGDDYEKALQAKHHIPLRIGHLTLQKGSAELHVVACCRACCRTCRRTCCRTWACGHDPACRRASCLASRYL